MNTIFIFVNVFCNILECYLVTIKEIKMQNKRTMKFTFSHSSYFGLLKMPKTKIWCFEEIRKRMMSASGKEMKLWISYHYLECSTFAIRTGDCTRKRPRGRGGGHWQWHQHSLEAVTLVLPIFSHSVFEHVGATPLLSVQAQSILSHNKEQNKILRDTILSLFCVFFSLSAF